MPSHPLVAQLQFTRGEFLRCLEGVTPEDALQRLGPMNCISWIVGHLAAQEHHFSVEAGQGRSLTPDLYRLVGYGQPASTPPLVEMWEVWHIITAAANEFLEPLGTADLERHLERKGRMLGESVGTMLTRNIYHYWFHTGEAHAIRQMLGHGRLPQFVGDMSTAMYRPE
ncbi:MAG: DinB family protein [Anaerolineae bacterium]|jgi:hypothetical protein